MNEHFKIESSLESLSDFIFVMFIYIIFLDFLLLIPLLPITILYKEMLLDVR
jgi:hypothetical protein